MTLRANEFRSVEQLVDDVAAEVAFKPGRVYVALVADPSTAQRLMEVRRLFSPALQYDWGDASDELCALMESFDIPERPGPPRHSAVTFVVRPGLCVLGPNESVWLSAWRYSNHFTNCYSSQLVLVTEHGWLDFRTDSAGHSPAMVA